jgi:hypothetical protein
MLDNNGDNQRLESHLRMIQIITGAMMMGIVTFMGIAIFLDQQRPPNVNQPVMLSTLAAAFFAIIFMAWWVIPDVVVNKQVEQIAAGTWTPGKSAESGKQIPPEAYPTDASKLLVVNQARSIIAAALLEGAAFFGCLVNSDNYLSPPCCLI